MAMGNKVHRVDCKIWKLNQKKFWRSESGLGQAPAGFDEIDS
jgi:hypothetical protein